MKNEDKQLHIRLPEELYKKLKVKCVYEDTSIQNYVANLVAESLGQYSVEEQPTKERSSRKPKGRR
jgi:predicted DNA binding CopG/RHH family protein